MRFKRFFLGTALLCGVAFAAPPKPVVEPLVEDADAGCWLYAKNIQPDEHPLFYEGYDQATMHIDGQERKLERLNKESFDPKRTQRYQSGEYQITIRYGRDSGGKDGEETDPHSFYEHARITVKRGKAKTVVKAQGGCGC